MLEASFDAPLTHGATSKERCARPRHYARTPQRHGTNGLASAGRGNLLGGVTAQLDNIGRRERIKALIIVAPPKGTREFTSGFAQASTKA